VTADCVILSPRESLVADSVETARLVRWPSRTIRIVASGLVLCGALVWMGPFGIAGAASIIRFRTPVDDPKDVTILFLLMGLGMSAGLGAFAVVGLGAAFLCTMLLWLGQASATKSRAMSVAIVASGGQFPSTHVEGVFARNHVVFEPREIAQSDNALVKYHARLDASVSLGELSAQLTREGAGVKSVAWEPAKRERV